MSIGHKGMLHAIQLLFNTGKELVKSKELIGKAKQELIQKRGIDFEYSALLGDRSPPLDYRQ